MDERIERVKARPNLLDAFAAWNPREGESPMEIWESATLADLLGHVRKSIPRLEKSIRERRDILRDGTIEEWPTKLFSSVGIDDEAYAREALEFCRQLETDLQSLIVDFGEDCPVTQLFGQMELSKEGTISDETTRHDSVLMQPDEFKRKWWRQLEELCLIAQSPTVPLERLKETIRFGPVEHLGPLDEMERDLQELILTVGTNIGLTTPLHQPERKNHLRTLQVPVGLERFLLRHGSSHLAVRNSTLPLHAARHTKNEQRSLTGFEMKKRLVW